MYGWLSCEGHGEGCGRRLPRGAAAHGAAAARCARAWRAGGRGDLSKQANLHPQRVEELVVLQLLALEDLYRNLAPGLLVLPLVDSRLGTGAELLLHLITLPNLVHLHIRQRLYPCLDIHLPPRDGSPLVGSWRGPDARGGGLTFVKSASECIDTFSDAISLVSRSGRATAGSSREQAALGREVLTSAPGAALLVNLCYIYVCNVLAA